MLHLTVLFGFTKCYTIYTLYKLYYKETNAGVWLFGCSFVSFTYKILTAIIRPKLNKTLLRKQPLCWSNPQIGKKSWNASADPSGLSVWQYQDVCFCTLGMSTAPDLTSNLRWLFLRHLASVDICPIRSSTWNLYSSYWWILKLLSHERRTSLSPKSSLSFCCKHFQPNHAQPHLVISTRSHFDISEVFQKLQDDFWNLN